MTRPGTPALRGDIVIVDKTEETYDRGADGKPVLRQYHRIDIQQVTSVSRTGFVRAARDAWGSTVRYPDGPRRGQVHFVVAAGVIDTNKAMDLARAHHYDGYPDQPKPFDTMEEVRELLTPLRRDLSAPPQAN